jgi:hypothetical protein
MSEPLPVPQLIEDHKKKIRNIKQTINTINSLQADVTQRLQQCLQNRENVKFDIAQCEPEFQKVSEGLSRLKAGQEQAREKFLKELATAREELLGEIQKVASTLESISPLPPPSSSEPSSPPPEATPPLERSSPPPSSSQPKKDAAPTSAKKVEITQFNFPFNPKVELDGIIAGLTRQVDGNVADKGVVDVNASGCLDPARFLPKFAADLLSNSVFVSTKDPNQWLAYDFKERKVRITHYAIRSRFDGWVNSNNLKSWVIEVSQDGNDWTIVDEKQDNNDLNGTNLVKAYELKEEVEARQVRLRQTGPAHSGKYFLAISGFEVFGTVIP